MSNWKIIVPETTTNYVNNPQFLNNVTDGWNFVTGTGGTRAQSALHAKFGPYSAAITAGTVSAAYLYFLVADQVSLANGASITASVYAYASNAGDVWLRIYDRTNVVARATAVGSVAGAEEKLEVTWTNTTGGAVNIDLFLVNTKTDGATVVYFDGVQLEIGDHSTTYCDGTQSGCEWNGAEHNSTSSRSGQSRAGGRVYDLQDDYYFDVLGMVGTGVNPRTLNTDSYAILPGGELNSIKENMREFGLSGVIRGDSWENLHALKQDLIDEIVGDKYAGQQPLTLRYTGATVDKEIMAYYLGGLEGTFRGDDPCVVEQNVVLRFESPAPYWYEIGQSAQVLDTNDTQNYIYVAARLKSTGRWDGLGPPSVAGQIFAIAIGPDKKIYYGGNFANFDGVAGADYITRYDPVSGAWELVGGASDLNGQVNALVFGPDGTLYAGGQFTNAGGDANADYVAQFDGSTWSAVGAGGTPNVLALAIGTDGTLYIGGSFTNWNAIANADYIVKWNGSAYSALSTGMNNFVHSLAVDSVGNLYAGGSFTTAGGAAANRIALWDGTSWSTPYNSTGMDNIVYALAITQDDQVYASGSFTTIDGVSINRIASWNGTYWVALGTGLNGIGYVLRIAPDGILYICGAFTNISGIVTPGIASWNGSSWAATDTTLPGTPSVRGLGIGESDPIVSTNYDVYIGFNTQGVGYEYAGTATVSNDGTAPSYPQITIERSGGTAARIVQIRNETTGKVILFNYSLLDGESLTIDTKPQAQSIVSSFFGPRPGAHLAGDDFGQFTLKPGDNQITAFVDVSGAPTVTAYCLWSDAYKSQD